MASKLDIKRELLWRSCEQDLLFFLREFWQVQRVGRGFGQFDLFDYQVDDAAQFMRLHRFANRRLADPDWRPSDDESEKLRQIRLKARQLGWTTLAGGAVFWSAFFHPHHPWLITMQSEDDAKDMLSNKIKQPYNLLPQWMRRRGPQVVSETQEVLEFDNGSSIMAIPSKSNSGRGKAVFGTLMDEAAFMENAEELFAAVDPMTYGLLFVFSTANGMGNFFHETWLESQLPDSEWEGLFWPWSARPDRDEEWHEAMRRRFRGKEHLFYQEHPSTPEEAFARSGRTAFDMDLLRDTQHWCPPVSRFDLLRMQRNSAKIATDGWERFMDSCRLRDDEQADMELHVWREPSLLRDEHGRLVQDPNFVVGVDVSEGLDHGDLSAITVIDVNSWEQVASVKAHIPVHDLDIYAEIIGYWYYTALIGVERNNHGLLPLARLQERSYPRLYRMDSIAQIRAGDRTTRYGWHTNRATKPKMVQDFASELQAESLLLHDRRLLHEASTFLADGKGGYGASVGNHDDLMMATLIAVQLGLDVGSYPIVWHDPDQGPPTFDEVFALAMNNNEWFGSALAGGIGQVSAGAPVIRSFEALMEDASV